jgi:putative acyl-CoA dehydrogenase
VATIIDMVQHTRLDCVIGSASLMRQALVQAIHHARHRKAFGKLLVDQPLMRNVLADLALESEAATILTMRLARAFDAREGDPGERGFARLGTAAAKYWVAKRGPAQVNEALECLGGNGFVEESVLPRLYREAPLNSIWEGSGNVICLDILRAMSKEPEAVSSVLAEIRMARGSDRRFDAFSNSLENDSMSGPVTELEARRLAERLALALQASLLIRHSIPEVADAFCATRLSDEGGRAFGTLPLATNFQAILNRAY